MNKALLLLLIPFLGFSQNIDNLFSKKEKFVSHLNIRTKIN